MLRFGNSWRWFIYQKDITVRDRTGSGSRTLPLLRSRKLVSSFRPAPFRESFSPSASGFLRRRDERASRRTRKSGDTLNTRALRRETGDARARARAVTRERAVALKTTVISRHNVSLVMIARRRSNYTNARARDLAAAR